MSDCDVQKMQDLIDQPLPDEKEKENKCGWCETPLKGSIKLCERCIPAVMHFKHICIGESKAEFLDWERIIFRLVPAVLYYFKEIIKRNAMNELIEEQQKK